MDQALSEHPSQPLDRAPVRRSLATIPRMFALLAISTLVLSSGCQTTQLGTGDLPVPPPILDVDSLDNIRLQSPGGSMSRNPAPSNRVRSRNVLPVQPVTADASQKVLEVNVTGNKAIPTHHLLRNVRTRPGRFFDPDALQQDIDQLWRMPEVSRIKGPYLNKTKEGVIVTIEVVERNTIREVKFVGNRGVTDRQLRKELSINDGDPLDVHQIQMAKTRIEEHYREKGYPRTQVEIMEGDQDGDADVVFLIHEDEKQRIWKVEFEGNTIATDGRLRNFIESKPGIMKVFGGLVNRNEIDQDVVRLTSYYRSLGFFNARIGREIHESNDGRWLTIRFIINEGPRYKIRNVTFVGNQSYSKEQLLGMLDLKPNEESSEPFFNVAKMNNDVVTLRDLYGSQGFVFAKVEAEPRFLEDPGSLDIVYRVEEGKQYYVGEINVHFQGDYGITKEEVVINRVPLRPGDLVNVQLIRNAERRLGAAQIFAAGGAPGQSPPRIVVRPPELKAIQRHADQSNGSSRYR